MTNLFIKSIFGKAENPIAAEFYSRPGEWIDYTAEIIDLLKSDPDTKYIIDSETGELIFSR